jgi:hypothetical protein
MDSLEGDEQEPEEAHEKQHTHEAAIVGFSSYLFQVLKIQEPLQKRKKLNTTLIQLFGRFADCAKN